MNKAKDFYYTIRALHPGVTGSCTIIKVHFPNGEIITFAIDYGAFQEPEYLELNSKLGLDPKKLDFLIVTHIHLDHIGRIPCLVRYGLKCVYTSIGTKKLAEIALKDNLRVLSKSKKKKKNKNKKGFYWYSNEDLNNTLEKMIPCEYNKTIKYNDNIKMTFFTNGHCVGALCGLVRISYPRYKTLNYFFTGDYKSENNFVEVKKLPKEISKMHMFINMEATYGTTDSTETVYDLEENIVTALENGVTVVIAAFSFDRTQNVEYFLKCMQMRGTLDRKYNIYQDAPLAKEYNNLYKKGDIGIKEEMRNFLPDNFRYVDKGLRIKLLKSKEPKIIIASSGMCSFGPVREYLKAYLPRENALIQATGFAVEGSLMHTILNAKKGDTIKIDNTLLTINCNRKANNQLSGHARKDELIRIPKHFENITGIAINHAEPHVKDAFKETLNKEGYENVVILGNDSCYRVYADGYEII